jgi:hypothetical protein
MKIEAKANCPLDGFKPCRQLECAWFMKVRGTNPNTGEEVDEWGCSIAWMPILLIENSQQQRQTGAAVESFRNEMVKANDASQQILLSAAQLSSSNNPTKFIDVK